MPAPGPDAAPARKGPPIGPAGRRNAGSVQIAVGLAVAIAGGVAAVAFMAFASPAAAPGSQGASAVGGADMDPGVQLPGPSGNATGDPPLPAPAPGLPTPSLPSLPS